MAFNSTLTVGSSSYERLTDGKWILSTATADEPTFLIIKSNVKASGNSDYLIRIERAKNSATPGAQDDVFSAHIVLKGPIKAFTQAEIEALVLQLTTFVGSTSNVTKLLRGER